MLNRVAQLVLIAFVSFVGLCLSAPVHAAEVDLSAIGHVGEVTTYPSSQILYPTSNPNTPITASNHSTSPGGGIAQGSVTGQLGTLKAYSYSYYPVTGNTYYATSESFGQFSDTGTAASSLTTITFALTGTYSPPYTATGSFTAEAIVKFRIEDLTSGLDQTVTFDTANITYPGLPATLTRSVPTTLDDSIRIIGSIDALTYINGDVNLAPNPNAAVVDLSATANFYVDQLGGVPFIGSTGYNYSSPVPIPPTALLLGSGLLGLGLLGYRRKKKA